jgi:2-succinyl-6-hydroxy-2,4-cyclohexadiene-1-carboxylate synthase
MGGRIALHVALAAPERVSHLILVATTAGIEDLAARAARARADAELATRIERATIEEFAERWTAQELFAGTAPDVMGLWRAELLRNAPAGVAAALLGLSVGVMEPLWDRLGELTMPATVLAGGRDRKYLSIAGRLVTSLPRARLVVVADAGHGLPREAPQAVAAALST